MFKFLVAFCVLVSAIGFIEAKMTFSEIKEHVDKIARTCADEVDASEDVLQSLKKGQIPEDDQGKCLMACMYKQFGSIKDGKYSSESIAEALLAVFDEDSLEYQKIKEITQVCEEELIDIEDECELAAQAMACEKRLFREAGMKVEE